jgi:hypothetical protein
MGKVFVGHDWAEAHHDVYAEDAEGRRLAKARLHRRRSRTSSSRSSAVRPSASPRSTRSRFTQLPSVPSLIPSSLAISAMGLPVSRTILTAPARNSGSNFLLVSGIVTPHR